MALITWMGVPGDAERWEALGFELVEESVTVSGVRLQVGWEPSWGFDELHGDAAGLGVPTSVVPPSDGRALPHPNGVNLVDHVVYAVPDLDDAVEALTEVLGAEPRRRFRPRGESGPEMAFYRVGEAFIEVVASGRPAQLMGVAFMCPDLDTCVAAVRGAGGMMGDPKPAVQGGRIASVPRDFGLPYGVAVMDRG